MRWLRALFAPAPPAALDDVEHAFNRVLAWVQAQENNTLRRQDVYAEIMEMRPEDR